MYALQLRLICELADLITHRILSVLCCEARFTFDAISVVPVCYYCRRLVTDVDRVS